MGALLKKVAALLLGVALGATAMLALSSTTIPSVMAGHGFAFTGERYIHLESDLRFA
jgi:hypothetical protein